MEDTFSMDREGLRGCFLGDSSASHLLRCCRFDRRQSSGSNASDGESEVAQSCPTLCNPMDCSPTRLLHPWDFPGKNPGVGCHFFSRSSQPRV